MAPTPIPHVLLAQRQINQPICVPGITFKFVKINHSVVFQVIAQDIINQCHGIALLKRELTKFSVSAIPDSYDISVPAINSLKL